jgi:diguanylate cyclase (GGDEF)-like protein
MTDERNRLPSLIDEVEDDSATNAGTLADGTSTNASYDPLTEDEPTGLPNRAFFVVKLAEMFEDSLRRNDSLSLMLVRVDGFDPIIAEHGRSAGDAILRKIARTIEGMIQIEGRIVARYRDEELAVILPNTSGTDALNTAEWLRGAFESSKIPVDDDIISATISGGVASRIDDGAASHFELIESAERGLAGAKIRGPNTFARPQAKS